MGKFLWRALDQSGMSYLAQRFHLVHLCFSPNFYKVKEVFCYLRMKNPNTSTIFLCLDE